MKAEKHLFKDDGKIPNNKLPLLLYKQATKERGEEAAVWFEEKFAKNNWKNSWRNGIFDYHHYHSNTHEVLGIYSGTALLKLGGERGKELRVSAGDVIVIPAGVAHKNLESEDFGVVGAYPEGKEHDMNTGQEKERPQADQNIAAVPLPDADPVHGPDKGLCEIWSLF